MGDVLSCSNYQAQEGEANPIDALDFYAKYDKKKIALLEEELLEVKRHPERLQHYTPSGDVGEEYQIIYMNEKVGEISPRILEGEGEIREGYVEKFERKRRPSTLDSPQLNSRSKNKRTPEQKLIYDAEIDIALHTNPNYVLLNEQISSMLKKKHEYTDENSKKLWNEQIKYSQDKLKNKLVKTFGRSRSTNYIERFQSEWEMLNRMEGRDPRLQGLDEKLKKIDYSQQFFIWFDPLEHGDIMLDEFVVICKLIDDNLFKENEQAISNVFMFLDQTNRHCFNEYDLKCFLDKSWGGVIEKFVRSLFSYFNNPNNYENQTQMYIKEFWRDYSHGTITEHSLDLSRLGGFDGSFIKSEQKKQFVKLQSKASMLNLEGDDVETQDQELLKRMKELRKEMQTGYSYGIPLNNIMLSEGRLRSSSNRSMHQRSNSQIDLDGTTGLGKLFDEPLVPFSDTFSFAERLRDHEKNPHRISIFEEVLMEEEYLSSTSTSDEEYNIKSQGDISGSRFLSATPEKMMSSSVENFCDDIDLLGQNNDQNEKNVIDYDKISGLLIE